MKKQIDNAEEAQMKKPEINLRPALEQLQEWKGAEVAVGVEATAAAALVACMDQVWVASVTAEFDQEDVDLIELTLEDAAGKVVGELRIESGILHREPDISQSEFAADLAGVEVRIGRTGSRT